MPRMAPWLLKGCFGSRLVFYEDEILAAIEFTYDLLDLPGSRLRYWQEHLLPRFRPQLQHQGRLGAGVFRGDDDSSGASNDAG
jgi:hypothetical protein